MAITKTAKNELYKILMGTTNQDIKSQLLQKPSYKGGDVSNYISEFKKQINSTNESIKKIIAFENKEIISIEYDVNGITLNALLFFNDIKELLYILDTQTNGSDPDLMPKIYDYKVSEEGLIFGFSSGIEDKVKDNIHFFIFNDILPFLDILNPEELLEESFFSAIFDVETEIKDEKGEVTGGNKTFGLIRDSDNKYGFNQDEKETDTFAFIVWESATKKVTLTRFSTDDVNIDPAEVSYDINEQVDTTEGNIGTSSNFEGITLIDVLTGERNAIDGNTSVGTIIYSTEKDAGIKQFVPIGFDVGNQHDPYAAKESEYQSTSFGNGTITGNGLITESANEVTYELERKYFEDTNVLNDIFDEYKKILDNPLEEYKGIAIALKYIDLTVTPIPDNPAYNKNKEYVLKITEAQFKKYYNLYEAGEKVYFIFNIKNTLKVVDVRNEDYDVTFDSNIYMASSGGQKDLLLNQHADFKDVPRSGLVQAKLNEWWISMTSAPGLTRSNENTSFDWNISLNIIIEAIIKYEREQDSISENTTSQIIIESGSDNNLYKIIQSENNSYSGTSPVFVNATKVYVPLKQRTNNRYAIFEFNGEKGTQLLNKYYNAFGDADYTDQGGDSFKQQLIEPNSIIAIQDLSVNVPIPADKYTLNQKTGIVTILGVTLNQQLEIEYNTLVGTPKKLHIDNSTTGEDVLITGVLDKKELGTISRAIVGAGDNSRENVDPTQIYGFNLYKDASSIDYNKLAEDKQDVQFKVSHVIGSRQNNILYIKAFNSDYSQYKEWVQIYPDSFKPYTYLPYANPRNYFAIERWSINKDLDRSTTTFDRAMLDVPPSTTSLVATTTAKSSDGNNQDNNKQVIYGYTNEPLFVIDKPLIKTTGEEVILNFDLETEFKDLLQGDFVRKDATERLIKLFTSPNTDTFENLMLDKFVITYKDGTTAEIPARDYIQLDSDNELINVGITLYNKNVGEADDKLPIKLELFNVGGDLISLVNLETDQCNSTFTDLEWKIIIADDPQPFFKWGANGWGEKPWAPVVESKGDK